MAKNWFHVAPFGIGFVAACLLSGCSPKLPANEKTYPVHGKVTMAGGGAVPKGTVVYFKPAQGTMQGQGAVGSDGTYQASIYRGQGGLVPGEYKIRVGGGEPEGQATVYEGELAKIPEKYRQAETSGLSLTVKPEDNPYDIELK